MDSKVINYAKLTLDNRTTERLFDFCREHQLGLLGGDDQAQVSADDFGFHITVMYSQVAHPQFKDGVYDIYPMSLRVDMFSMFGPNHDILALKLKKEKLFINLHEYYLQTYGHVSDFPANPHISIKGSKVEDKERVYRLPRPTFDIVANKLTHKVKIVTA